MSELLLASSQLCLLTYQKEAGDQYRNNCIGYNSVKKSDVTSMNWVIQPKTSNQDLRQVSQM